MNGKINNTLLTTLQPTASAIEVNDSDLKGFGLRIQPSGVMSYFVRYRLRGKQTRYGLGALLNSPLHKLGMWPGQLWPEGTWVTTLSMIASH